MKLKEEVSWLMGKVQQSLFPHLDECLSVPLTEREQHLVKINELILIEKFVPALPAVSGWDDRAKSEKRLPGPLL